MVASLTENIISNGSNIIKNWQSFYVVNLNGASFSIFGLFSYLLCCTQKVEIIIYKTKYQLKLLWSSVKPDTKISRCDYTKAC